MRRATTLPRAETPQLFATQPKLNERQWQTVIQKRLGEEGWAWQHVYRLQTKDGHWRTSTTARGWPDLVAFRDAHLLGIECKSGTGSTRVEPGQLDWLERFALIPTGRAWLLDPVHTDWQALANWLRWPENAPRRFGFAEGGLALQ